LVQPQVAGLEEVVVDQPVALVDFDLLEVPVEELVVASVEQGAQEVQQFGLAV